MMHPLGGMGCLLSGRCINMSSTRKKRRQQKCRQDLVVYIPSAVGQNLNRGSSLVSYSELF